jgi:peroxiredoxin
MKKILIVCIAVLSVESSSMAQNKFSLDGFVEGYSGNVKLLINVITNDHEADMENEQVTYMRNGRFRLEGQFDEPIQLSIRIRPEITEDFDPRSFESVFIWAENKPMKLHGKKGNFEYAEVTGSSLQDEHSACQNYIREKISRHYKKIDSLSHINSSEAKEQLKQLSNHNEIYLRNRYRLDYSYENPESFISVYNYSWFIKWIPEMVPKSHASEFYNMLNSILKQSIFGKQIRNYIENVAVNQKLRLGDRPYDFALPDAYGGEITLNSLKGNIILLDFWAANCGPCRKEHANYSTLYEKFKEQGFTILSVSQDRKKDQWTKAMEKDKIVWPSVWDESMHISKYTYLVTGIPQNYLVDSDGIIIAENVHGKRLESLLEAIFTK